MMLFNLLSPSLQLETKKYNILVTRPKHQAETLCHSIEQQGWNAIRFPTIQIVGIDSKNIKHQLDALKQYHWLIFISANAVNFALKANDGKIDNFNNSDIAAVGKATEKALQTYGLTVALVPKTHFNTEGLLETPEMNRVRGSACLIVRGKGGLETLADCLRERGAKVEYMEVYERIKPCHNDNTAKELLELGKLHAITITSGHALFNLLGMFDKVLHCLLHAVPLIVISHRIKKMAEQSGFKHIAVTEYPDDSAIIDTLITSLGTRTY
jgi:uroporphyrinogen-III synthase